MTTNVQKWAANALEVSQKDRQPSTIKGYDSDFNSFVQWCETENECPLPASEETVAGYLYWMMAEAKPHYAIGTAEHHRNAINYYHVEHNHPTPCTKKIDKILIGLKKTFGKPPNKKHPFSWKEIKEMVDLMDTTCTKGARDKAVLLLAYASAMRASEISTLQIKHLRTENGLSLFLQDTKTDRDGSGQIVNIATIDDTKYCAVAALFQWLRMSGIERGYIFRGLKPATRGWTLKDAPYAAASIRNMFKDYAEQIGIDRRTVGAHSTRRGLATEAKNNGADIYAIKEHLRHKNVKTTEGYCDFSVGHGKTNPLTAATA
jgi:site-specific recombinase XerD